MHQKHLTTNECYSRSEIGGEMSDVMADRVLDMLRKLPHVSA
jgi:hypothetical protein